MNKELIDSLRDQIVKRISILKDRQMALSIENKVIEYSTRLEVSPCLGEMNWENAIKACEELGEGWRLPTLLELHIMYPQKSKDDKAVYWSSTELTAPIAFYFDFTTGYAANLSKSGTLSVRGVRDI